MFKFAGYYKDLANLVTNDDDMVYLNQGAGFAQGTEVSSCAIALEIDFWAGVPTRMDSLNAVTGQGNRIATIHLTKHTLRPLQRLTDSRQLGRSVSNGSTEPATPIPQYETQPLKPTRVTANLSTYPNLRGYKFRTIATLSPVGYETQ